jgi:diguanylate cyclase (GGDEF)-like protein
MSGSLWLIATAPIQSHDFDQKVHGVLVLAQRVDQTFAGIVAGLVNTEVTFFVKDEVLASTNARLADRLEAPAAYAVLKDAKDLVQTGAYASRGTYLGVDGTDGLIVVSNDRAPISTAQKALQRSMVFAFVPAIALACLVAIVLGGKMLRPLRSLRAAVNAIAFGDLDQRVQATGDDEIADLGRAFNAMAERVSTAQQTLRRAAVRDSLTGLLNHREFYRRLTDEIARCERAVAPLSVMMIDLDYFKGINDTYGHLRGDAVLREVASVITRGVREADVVARYAGDEFAVILPMTAEADAFRIAERVRTSLEDVVALVDLPEDERVTLSIGVATRWPGEHTANQTVELADLALYHAKESGRNRVAVGDDIHA